MKQIAMAIKLDHELRFTRRRSPDMQNFEADLSMMVPRPYESILGGREKCFGRKLAETGSRPDSRGSMELNRRPGRPGEGQGGLNKGHLDPTIGQKNTKKSISSYYGGQVCKYGQAMYGHTVACVLGSAAIL